METTFVSLLPATRSLTHLPRSLEPELRARLGDFGAGCPSGLSRGPNKRNADRLRSGLNGGIGGTAAALSSAGVGLEQLDIEILRPQHVPVGVLGLWEHSVAVKLA